MIDDPRATWAARPPIGALSRWPGAVRGLCVHWVGGPGNLRLPTHDACLQLTHILQAGAFSGANGWTYADLEYNLLACPHGRLIEGRGLGWMGAAQKNANREYASVVALLNQADHVTPPLLVALNKARAAVHAQLGGDELLGHRDAGGNPTGSVCPGAELESWVRNPTIPEPEDDMTDEQAAALQQVREGMLIAVDALRHHDEQLQNITRALYPNGGDVDAKSRPQMILDDLRTAKGAVRSRLDAIAAELRQP